MSNPALVVCRGLRPAALALAVLAGSASLAAAGDWALAAHRAVYELALAKMKVADGPDTIRGRILYDFGGNRCDGYTLQFRQVSELGGNDKPTILSDLRSTSWEAADGSSYRFVSQNYLNDKEVSSAEGRATRERADGPIQVTLTKPEARSFALDAKTVFPAEQMRRILDAARAGQTLLELPVFDGSESGEKVYQTLTVIGAPVKPAASPLADAAKDVPALAAMTRWPVTISYYEPSKKPGEQVPTYGMSFELFENGVSRALKMDYEKFTVSGTMAKLDLPAETACR